MKNIEMQVDKNILTVKIDLSKNFGASKSGKTEIIASTLGNVTVPGNDNVKIGINCYK